MHARTGVVILQALGMGVVVIAGGTAVRLAARSKMPIDFKTHIKNQFTHWFFNSHTVEAGWGLSSFVRLHLTTVISLWVLSMSL